MDGSGSDWAQQRLQGEMFLWGPYGTYPLDTIGTELREEQVEPHQEDLLEGGHQMSRYEASVQGRLIWVSDGSAVDAAQVETIIDLVVTELEKLDAEDIDVSTNLSDAHVRVAISLEAEDLLTAQVEGGGTLRAAFHAASIGTPGWDVDWIDACTVPEGDFVDA
jgi:hypothetical protein